MSSYLINSSGFTSGAFSILNTGEIGKGWGINTATFFEPVQNPVFNITHRGGIIIDFYSFVLMNPFEKLDFLFNSDIHLEYFNIIQSDNLLFIYPKTSKLIQDNFQDTEFNGTVICANAGTNAVTIDFRVVYTKESLTGANEYILNYIDNIHSIPLSTLIKESLPESTDLTSKFSIVSINGMAPTVDSNEAISNGLLDLTKLSIGTDSTIVLKYDDNTNGSYYEFKLKLLNYLKDQELETKVTDIILNITPVLGEIISIKDFAIGDTRNLVCYDISSPQDLPFKFQALGSLIGVTPITTKALLVGNKVYTKKLVYQTEKSKGVFNLTIVLINNGPTDLEVLKRLNPIERNKTFKLTNGNLTEYKFFNFESLLNNRIFDDYSPIITFPQNIEIETNSVDGSNIRNIGSLSNGLINLKFITEPGYYGTNPTANSYSININIESDNQLIQDPLDVAPITFEVSKNYCTPKNLFDYISAPHYYYKDLVFTDLNNKLTLFGNLQLVAPNTSEYKNIDIENNTFEGFIEVKHTSYTNDSNVDDYGNIIGYRKIPYTINYINKPYSSEDIEPQNIKIYYDLFNDPIEMATDTFGIFGYLDTDSIDQSKSSIDILENPTNIIPVHIIDSGNQVDNTKVQIIKIDTGYILLLMDTGYTPPVNSILKLLIKYTNELNLETIYEHNIFFLKKEI